MGVVVDYSGKINMGKTVGDKVYGLDTVFITGAGYYNYPFRGINRESQLGWEETTWGGDLSRSVDFKLYNIGDVKFGLVARVEIGFNYQNIADYKILQEIAHERVCYVTYYNRDKSQWVENQEMAFTGNELDKIYGFRNDDIGRLGVKIKLVATNRDKALQTYLVVLNANGGTGGATYNKTWCESVDLSKVEVSYTGKTLKYWANNADESQATKKYFKNALLTITDNITLYAIWE